MGQQVAPSTRKLDNVLDCAAYLRPKMLQPILAEADHRPHVSEPHVDQPAILGAAEGAAGVGEVSGFPVVHRINGVALHLGRMHHEYHVARCWSSPARCIGTRYRRVRSVLDLMVLT